ncbi:cytochrome P450 [Catenaria anguillulae PL171]|uniref:Cytochrome P450 n=1 Tax=Catenaria anguillulae PL171 TaxID=765915 RepID=A0A1Y2HWW2_9FUNG|nr:cytochrome P450 [Catenaria anguillulae PL171]
MSSATLSSVAESPLATHIHSAFTALVSGSPATPILTILAALVPYILYKAYKAVAIPAELAHLPRVPIKDTIRALLTPGGFPREYEVQEKAIKEWCAKHGRSGDSWRDMYLVWQFGKWGVVLGKPDLIKTFFVNVETFPKLLYSDFGMALNDKYLGVNVTLSNGSVWKQHRKITNPAFHRQWSTQLMGDVGRTLLQQLDLTQGSPTDLFDWMQRTTLDILSLAAYGQNLDALTDPTGDLVRLYNSIMHDLQLPYFLLFPILQRTRALPLVRDLSKRIDKFHAYLNSIIDKKEKEVKRRVASGETKNEKDMDLLERMIEANLKDDGSFSRDDLRSNVVIFFIAGHDTTAATLTTAIYYMGMNLDVQAKARAEVLKVYGDIDPTLAASDFPYLTTAEQGTLNYVTYVLKEALRLYPSVSGLPLRRTAKDAVLDGVTIPKDTPIHIDTYGLQRNPKYWGADAAHFKPERWENYTPAPYATDKNASLNQTMGATALSEMNAVVKGEASGSIPMVPSAHNFSFIPFGGGQRFCLGQQFSVMEQRVLLAMILARYEWKVVGNESALKGLPTTSSGVILHPLDVKIKFERRK